MATSLVFVRFSFFAKQRARITGWNTLEIQDPKPVLWHRHKLFRGHLSKGRDPTISQKPDGKWARKRNDSNRVDEDAS
jgi:hypothetical protein